MNKEPDILQFAVDVSVTDDNMEKKIEDALIAAGLDVLGVAWSARWTYERYHKGQEPVSSC